MRRRSLLAGLLGLALLAGAAQAQQQPSAPPAARIYSQADLWDRNESRITFRLAHLSFPVRAGSTRLSRILEASREGQGLDNALQYFSPDEQVFATIYVYAPGLPDAGLTAFMTDYAIHVQSDAGLSVLRSGIVAAGGREGVAIRLDYAGFRQNRLASSAAFMRVGRWIVKLRVSGPEARRAEVEGTMASLLAELRFEGQPLPAAAAPIVAPDCPQAPDRAAHPLSSDGTGTMEDAILSHFLESDGTVGSVRTAEPDARQPGPHWCRSPGFRLANMSGPTPVLRATTPGAGDDTRRSVLFALIADNGTMLEVVERRFRNRTRYVLVHHQIGRTMILGAYDAVPTDAQLADILSGRDQAGGRARATIVYQASGDSTINLLVPMDVPAMPARPRT